MTPKVSVVIPVYNVEKYLAACLDSALCQTLSPIELICVDDGSTDSSPEILAAYAARDGRIQVVRQANGGLSAARNAGMAAARGEYLLFLDSDDRIASPDALELLFQRAAAGSLDMLFFDARMAYESEELRRVSSEPEDFYVRKHGYPDCTDGRSLYLLLEENGEYRPNAYLYLLRREFVERGRLRFPDGIYHEDEVFTLEAMSLAERASCAGVCGYERLWREGSIMTEGGQFRRIRGNLLAARALEDFAGERLSGTNSVFLRRYLRHARAINLRGYRQYLKLPPGERDAFAGGIVPQERAAIKSGLRAGRREMRARAVRLWFKGILPTRLWSTLKARG